MKAAHLGQGRFTDNLSVTSARKFSDSHCLHSWHYQAYPTKRQHFAPRDSSYLPPNHSLRPETKRQGRNATGSSRLACRVEEFRVRLSGERSNVIVFDGGILLLKTDNVGMHCLTEKITAVVFIGLLTLGFTTNGFAQNNRSFDAERYFQRLDRNGDERLDASELNPKAINYLRRIGVDVNDNRIRLRTIRKRLEANKESAGKQLAQQEKDKLDRNLKVPGFGVPAEESAVSGFGSADTTESIEYSESTLEMVNTVLRRYDNNGDSMIDQEERKRGRWGRPDPNESDLNKDGILSRNELARRYHVRELEQRKRRDESNSRESEERNSDTTQDRRREEARRASSERTRGGGRSAAATTVTRSGNRSSEKDREAYEKYSKSLIARYDKDNDDRLSKAEWKAVRRPPANADQNKDGYVTQKEYADALMAAAGKKSGSQATSNSRSSTQSSNNRSTKGRTAGGDMAKLDANEDAQVQMHEYSSDWDEGKLDEFYSIDKNRDGVITASEWKLR